MNAEGTDSHLIGIRHQCSGGVIVSEERVLEGGDLRSDGGQTACTHIAQHGGGHEGTRAHYQVNIHLSGGRGMGRIIGRIF